MHPSTALFPPIPPKRCINAGATQQNPSHQPLTPVISPRHPQNPPPLCSDHPSPPHLPLPLPLPLTPPSPKAIELAQPQPPRLAMRAVPVDDDADAEMFPAPVLPVEEGHARGAGGWVPRGGGGLLGAGRVARRVEDWCGRLGWFFWFAGGVRGGDGGWDGMGWVKGRIRCQVRRWRRSTLLDVSFDYRCDGSFETLWWEIGTFRLGPLASENQDSKNSSVIAAGRCVPSQARPFPVPVLVAYAAVTSIARGRGRGMDRCFLLMRM